MILQALYAYYHRLKDEPDSGIAQPGFTPKKIDFALVLDKGGKLLQVQDIRDTTGKKPRPVELMVPEEVIRSSGISANFLCDNTGYVLGFSGKGKPEKDSKTFKAFYAKQIEIGSELKDEGMQAVLAFLKTWKPEKAKKWQNYEEIADSNLVFRFENERRYIHERPAVKKAWLKYKNQNDTGEKTFCLITGEQGLIACLHPKIKGVRDAQTAGAAIVSFNADAYESYDKSQSYNAPVSEEAAFAYTTALNHLLAYNSHQKIQISDATTVFWTERASPVEGFLGIMLDPRESEAADTKEIADYLLAIRAGRKPASLPDDSVRFHILGLAPNAARIAVRFWYVDTLEMLNRHLGRYFGELQLIPEFAGQSEFPGIWRLLMETAPKYQTKDKTINPLLAGYFMRSVLTGGLYPAALLSTLLARMRADGEVNYHRMALVKAILMRNYQNKEVTMSLNEESTNTAYRLGRLFAVLEKAQKNALGDINTTIKDRFFGAASATPRIVFPQLIRLSQHHLNKLEGGNKVYFEQLIQAILDCIEVPGGFPGFLRLEEQGLFALGYYHQRRVFYTKKDKEGESGEAQPTE